MDDYEKGEVEGTPIWAFLDDAAIKKNKADASWMIFNLHVDQDTCFTAPKCPHYFGIGCLSPKCHRKDASG